MKSRQKILFVITKSNMGGAQQYVFDLATSLPQESFEVSVACGGNGLLTTKLKEKGIVVHHIKSFERDIDLKKEFAVFRELTRLLGRERPDIVHLNSSKAGGVGALAARFAGVPMIVFTAHGWPFFEKRNAFARATIWFLSWITTLLSHHTIVVSQHDLTHARMYGLRGKLRHIPLGIETIEFASRIEARAAIFSADVVKRHIGDTWFVSIAEHTHNKNLMDAIRAVEAYNKNSERKIFYTLIGRGELTDTYKTYIQENNLTDQIQLLGFVADARRFLKAFDVFLLPSLKEGFPYALLEAGQAELAVVASNVGGIPELITHHSSGVLTKPNEESLTKALTKLMTDTRSIPAYRGVLAQKVATYSKDALIKRTRELYES